MIHKQGTISHGSIFTIPFGSNIIKADYQFDKLYFWYAFDEDRLNKTVVSIEFAVVGTGWDFDLTGWIHVNTVFQTPYVWHIFVRETQ